MKPILRNLIDIGVGYLSLNRGVGTLSVGELPRVKMTRQLGCDLIGLAYIFDEPTIGRHMTDIERLLDVVSRLVDGGNTVIEHNLDDIKYADWVIDMGPEGGSNSGEIIAEGTPEQIAQVSNSYTGQYLKKALH